MGKVFIVETDSGLRKSLEIAFRTYTGLEVVAAKTLPEVLGKFGPHDVMVLDLEEPTHLGGRLKEQIVTTTAWQHLRADFPKPFNLDALIERVVNVMRKVA